MKKLLIYLLPVFCAIQTGFAQEKVKNHPGVDYNDVIVGEHRVLLSLVTDYLVQTVHSEDFAEIERKRKQVIDQVESAITKVQSLGDFEGDTKMRDEALAVLRMYKEAYTQDFNTINTLRAESQKSYEAMTQYLRAEELAEEKLNNTLKRFNKAQEEFADRHNLIIDMGGKKHPMDIIFQVYKYNREVFLQYFKVFIQNESCLNALYEQDAEKLDRERKKLILYAQDAHASLKSTETLKQDGNYKQSAMAYISFHIKFAQGGMLDLVKYFNNKSPERADATAAQKLLDQYNQELGQAEDAFHTANILLLRTHIPQELTKEN